MRMHPAQKRVAPQPGLLNPHHHTERNADYYYKWVFLWNICKSQLDVLLLIIMFLAGFLFPVCISVSSNFIWLTTLQQSHRLNQF